MTCHRFSEFLSIVALEEKVGVTHTHYITIKTIYNLEQSAFLHQFASLLYHIFISQTYACSKSILFNVCGLSIYLKLA